MYFPCNFNLTFNVRALLVFCSLQFPLSSSTSDINQESTSELDMAKNGKPRQYSEFSAPAKDFLDSEKVCFPMLSSRNFSHISSTVITIFPSPENWERRRKALPEKSIKYSFTFQSFTSLSIIRAEMLLLSGCQHSV